MEEDEISALLTPKQREYLLGNTEIEEKSAQERTIRSRIRSRLSKSMEDMVLLQRRMEMRDIEKTFGMKEVDHIRNALALMFLGAFRSSPRTNDAEVQSEETLEMFEDLIIAGLDVVYMSTGSGLIDIDVTIDADFGEDAELADISDDILVEMLRSGAISPEEFESAYGRGGSDE